MDLIIAMALFSFVMSVSPGPVNIITLTSGLNHGFSKTLPFVLGATIGFTLLLFLAGLGVIQLLQAFPNVMKIASYFGAGFIFYMGYKIFTSTGKLEIGGSIRPHFYQGALLQWLNPKAWLASISGVSAFVTEGNFESLITFSLIYFILCYIGIGCWAVIGAQSKHILNSEKRLTIFNRVMGGVLAIIAIFLAFFADT